MKHFLQKHNYLITLFLIFAVAEILVQPWGNFPLNDDWSYAKSVQWFGEQGKILLGDWPAMTLATHIIWGFLFSKIFGFSFFILRVSTWVSALIGLYALFQIAFIITQQKKLAFALCLALLFNPIYFNLANTFMTDVNFCTLFVLGIYVAFQFFEKPRLVGLVGIFLISLAIVLLRQYGLVFPLAFSVSCLFLKHKRRQFSAAALSIFFLTFLIYKQYEVYLASILSPRSAYKFSNSVSLRDHVFWSSLLEALTTRYKIVLIHLLFYPFVFAFGFTPAIWKQMRWYWHVGILSVITVLTVYFFKDENLLVGNIFANVAVGTDTTYLTLSGNYSGTPHFYSIIFQAVLNVLKIVFIAFTVYTVVTAMIIKIKNEDELPSNSLTSIFSVLLLLAYVVMIMITDTFFDRYQIPVFVLSLLLMASIFRKFEFSLYWFLIPFLFWCYVSVSGTRDYFSWNTLKWKAYNDLTAKPNMNEKTIQSGFEIMCWEEGPQKFLRDFSDIHKFDYCIQFDRLDSFSVIKSYPFKRWLLVGQDTLHVYKRNLFAKKVVLSDSTLAKPTNQ